jgi:DNA-binding transcriptional MerR regulator
MWDVKGAMPQVTSSKGEGMRIGALSTATGVSVATLKYYVREGLLPSGTATAVNQAEYDESHVRRVRLIRALADLGRLGIADIADVLDAVDDHSLALHDTFAVAQDALVVSRPRGDRSVAATEAALAEVDRFVRRHRLHVRPDAAVRTMLADVLVFLEQFGWGSDSTMLDGFVPPLVRQATDELSMVPAPAERGDQMEYSVVGTVAFEVATNAIRRMALEDASWRRFGPGRRRRSVGDR